MQRYYFNFADIDTYDDISRWRCHTKDVRFTGVRKGLVPMSHARGWTHTTRGIWTMCRPKDSPLTEKGWKLHISVTQDSFDHLLELVSQHAVTHRVPFKFLARYEYVWLINSKYARRSGSGKGIVLYPVSTEQAVSLADELASLTRGVEGPRILSDLRIDGTVVHARYGSFARRYCRDDKGELTLALEDDQGRLVPDTRSVPFSTPDFVSVPEEFRRAAANRESSHDDMEEKPPYRVEKVLHFSNSGGVYLATHESSGESVILKEARPFAGESGSTGGYAIDRARKEYDALRLTSDLPEFPDAYGQFTWQSHLFTAMEYVRGSTLQEWCAANQPFLLRENPFDPPTEAEKQDYRDKVDQIIGQVTKGVHALWERGYTFGDIHAANVLVAPDLSVKLIDLETCVPEGERRPLPGAPGFSRFDMDGRRADEYALAMLRLSCYVPLTPLLRFEHGKLRQYLHVARERFGLSKAWGDDLEQACGLLEDNPHTVSLSPVSSHLDEALGFSEWTAQLITGLRARMNTERSDRLFPGEFSGFGLSPVSLASGSSGVLWPLLETEGIDADDLVEEIVDWTVLNARTNSSSLHCGLYDSELGAGLALRAAGYPDHARWVANMALEKDRSGCNASVFNGSSGIFLATVALASGPDPLVDDATVEQAGAELHAQASELFTRLRTGEDAVYGLMHGIAGVALALHRYGLLVGDPSLVEMARELMEFELSAYVRCADGSLQYNEHDRRTLSYLEEGSCGAALVLSELGEHEGWRSSHASPADLIRALGPEVMVQSGLFRGRAGFMAGLTELSRRGWADLTDPLIERHTGQLGLHELRPGGGELHYPSAGNFKLSCDLRAGSAGVLTGVAFASGRRGTWLPGLF